MNFMQMYKKILRARGPQSPSALEHFCANLTTQETLK